MGSTARVVACTAGPEHAWRYHRGTLGTLALRASAVLVAIYGCVWAVFGVLAAGVPVSTSLLPHAPARSSDLSSHSAGVLSLPVYAAMTAVCWSMAVGLWRRSARWRTAGIVVASAVALALIVLLGNDGLRFVDHPGQFDPGQLLGWMGATLAGPGLILALLLPRASQRATGAAPSSTPWPL